MRMGIQGARWCLLLLASAGVAAGIGAKTQTSLRGAQEAPGSKKQQALIPSVEGVDLYRAYCATCHGTNGKGNGPMAPALKAAVPDLTLIAKNNRGQFPETRIRRILTGEDAILSHGSREMPVWGPIFHETGTPVDRGPVRLNNLVKYLESIQGTGKM